MAAIEKPRAVAANSTAIATHQKNAHIFELCFFRCLSEPVVLCPRLNVIHNLKLVQNVTEILTNHHYIVKKTQYIWFGNILGVQ